MGRNFANKLWNASRFLLMHERPKRLSVTSPPNPELADAWIQTHLNRMLETVEDRIQNYRLDEALLAIYDFIWHDYCDWYLELIKPRLYNAEDAAEREGTLALALRIFETSLRALHPFMPFVTEELWQQIAAIEGLGLQIKEPRSIMVQEYPKSSGENDSEATAQMELLQDVITAVRNIRGEMSVPPKSEAALLITGPEAQMEILRSQFTMLKTLARVSRLDHAESRPAHSASAVVGSLEIFIPLEGLIDLGVERGRLEKEITRHQSMAEGTRRKLANEAFVQNAPAEIVEKERVKLSEAQAALEKLQRNLKSLE
jgi:valyl-tRNA synthetase